MSELARPCRMEEISDGDLKRFTVGYIDVLVTSVNGYVYALEDRCGHMCATLSLGALEGIILTCPLHNGTFDVTTGAIVRPPDPPRPEQIEENRAARVRSHIRTYPVQTFEVEEQDEAVYARPP